MNSIVVFGASGQLGQCIKAIKDKEERELIYFLDKADADILNPDKLDAVFKKYQPAYCINCAAYTAVDKAEDSEADALLLNKTGAKNLSMFCKTYKSTLIHISTDFVFKGDKVSLLNEDDETLPINIYGKTKLDGEKAIQSVLKEYFIIRTGWLYSEFGNNFVKTMLKLGNERPELKVIADQVGTPTYAIDLARFILLIIDSHSLAYGVYNFSNEGVASWYDFAKAIFNISGKVIKILPLKTEEYITKASRPLYSVLDKSKVKQEFDLELPYWRDSLSICIRELQKINK